ncbi:hypothetical protein [Halorhabdus sp. CBA1104]|uniref:hypothetical protein n=1 Tax=Halorhabdus sp. CBA1104 TaxID=1380432 RepID=UPI0012B1DD93|nr:hypothetical protein [Halorhabdus sp. CBA1104]
MSQAGSTEADIPDAEEAALEELYDLREELKLVAEADVAYAKYAENGLERLREAGYDV